MSSSSESMCGTTLHTMSNSSAPSTIGSLSSNVESPSSMTCNGDDGSSPNRALVHPAFELHLHEDVKGSPGEQVEKEKGGDSRLKFRIGSIRRALTAARKRVWPSTVTTIVATDTTPASTSRWILHPQESNSPRLFAAFYTVPSGVPFQEIVPERPSRFPYTTPLEYSLPSSSSSLSRSFSSLLPTKPGHPMNRMHVRGEALRREQLNRMVLKKLKAKGSYRRRPNITLAQVEGRETEAVQVARIRRAYVSPLNELSAKKGRWDEPLIEKLNRQARACTVEWIVTRIHTYDVRERDGSIEESVKRSSSTKERDGGLLDFATGGSARHYRNQGSYRPVNKVGGASKPAMLANANRLTQLNTRLSYEAEMTKKKKLKAYSMGHSNDLEQTQTRAHIATLQSIPELVITSCEGTDAMPVKNKLTVSNLNMLSPDGGSASMHRLASCSNRSSMYSMLSGVSNASSLPNSVYTTLSEEWNRPIYYTKPKSQRYPASMLTKISVIPPHVNVQAWMRSKLVGTAKPGSRNDRVAKAVEKRGLKDIDGSSLRLENGDRLYRIRFRIVLEPIQVEEREEEGVGYTETDNDPSIRYRCHCKTAEPFLMDALGFVEYDYGNEDYNEHQQWSSYGERVTGDAPTSSRPSVERAEKRQILDVNDVSAMAATGIDPNAQHPEPEAFYNHYHARFLKHRSFVDRTAEGITTAVAESVTSNGFLITSGTDSTPMVQMKSHVVEEIGRPSEQSSGRQTVRSAYQSFRRLILGRFESTTGTKVAKVMKVNRRAAQDARVVR
ncbi:hypothetical protein BGZ99_001768 [Dissophora globulifera]|uniref:Uncharacterized protein n=1 Tax=Dissophora globulifera TaxID=979702 RepID=A0A9P6UXP1_9FUNG|nr:hypothetical protein BGZ99_001768 [Dissophora globulifera]